MTEHDKNRLKKYQKNIKQQKKNNDNNNNNNNNCFV